MKHYKSLVLLLDDPIEWRRRNHQLIGVLIQRACCGLAPKIIVASGRRSRSVEASFNWLCALIGPNSMIIGVDCNERAAMSGHDDNSHDLIMMSWNTKQTFRCKRMQFELWPILIGDPRPRSQVQAANNQNDDINSHTSQRQTHTATTLVSEYIRTRFVYLVP